MQQPHQSQKNAAPVNIRIDRAAPCPQASNLPPEQLGDMHAESPPDKVYALDLSALREPQITLQTAWRAGSPPSENGQADGLMARGAIKELDPSHGEIKSMRTSARFLRQGAAQAVLRELFAIARQRGYAQVSLETGTTPGFDAAVAMYRRFGFVDCGPFGEYRVDVDAFSRFMTQELV